MGKHLYNWQEFNFMTGKYKKKVITITTWIFKQSFSALYKVHYNFKID